MDGSIFKLRSLIHSDWTLDRSITNWKVERQALKLKSFEIIDFVAKELKFGEEFLMFPINIDNKNA